jgi:hypothetical protein
MLIFLLLTAVTVSLLLWAAIHPYRFYEYPYFMAGTVAAFILPQAYALLNGDWGGFYLGKTLLMATLCVSACWFGYIIPSSRRLVSRLQVPVSPERLLHGGILLIAAGYVFTIMIARLPEEQRNEAMWSGVITIYAFFAQLIYPGFAIALYCYLHNRDIRALLASIVSAFMPIHTALFYARREPTVLFILSVAVSAYFLRGKAAPRWLAISSIIFAACAIPVTGQYRSLAEKDPLEALKSIDLTGQWANLNEDDAVSEVKNATILIAATDMRDAEQWGAGYWDVLVHRFVPAQLLSKEFKESLKIGGDEQTPERIMEDAFGFIVPGGSTITGIGDAYYEFGMWGCFVFGAIGYMFRILWDASHGSAGTIAQVLYIQTMTSAMRALTHQTTDFLPGFLYSLIFIGAVSIYAREPSRADSDVRISQAIVQDGTADT